MKKLTLIMMLAVFAIIVTSCGKSEYMRFIGTWGVDRIEYYNTDWEGNPIEASLEVWDFTPGDMEGGIDLVFREDKTGEMRDRSRDTLYVPVKENGVVIDTLVIICPDTTVVTKFSYSFNDEDGLLFMNMQVAHPFTYWMSVTFIDDDNFIYKNRYDTDIEEKAWMVRYSTETRGSKARGAKSKSMPRHPKSLLSNY